MVNAEKTKHLEMLTEEIREEGYLRPVEIAEIVLNTAPRKDVVYVAGKSDHTGSDIRIAMSSSIHKETGFLLNPIYVAEDDIEDYKVIQRLENGSQG